MALTAPSKHQLDLQNAIWIDLNPLYGQNTLPIALPDAQSVTKASLFALLNCHIGDRGGIFEPLYGTNLPWFLQEPICEETAGSMKMSLYNSLKTWEPRLEVPYNGIEVTPDYDLPGYRLTVTGVYKSTKEQVTQSYVLSAG